MYGNEDILDSKIGKVLWALGAVACLCVLVIAPVILLGSLFL